jgi:hypothetical protein
MLERMFFKSNYPIGTNIFEMGVEGGGLGFWIVGL